MERATYTPEEVLNITIEMLRKINIPVELSEEVGLPVRSAIINLKAIRNAMEASRVAEEIKEDTDGREADAE